MKNLSEWKIEADIKLIEAIAFDLDDTLTSHAQLSSKIIDALEKCLDAGLKVFLVTGRPAGWADALIKLLPFDGVVAENGGLFFYWPKGRKYKKEGQEPTRQYWSADGFKSEAPQNLADKKQKLSAEILKGVPRVRVASDQPYRIYDLAIDFAEEVVPPLSFEEASKILPYFEKAGATAKLSSIHINGWWGNFSKASSLKILLEHYGLSLSGLLYVGDSPNDGPLFEVAAYSVGVSNIRAFANRSDFVRPRFVASKESGEGALEIIETVLTAKVR